MSLAAKESTLHFPLHHNYINKERIEPIVTGRLAFNLIFFDMLEYEKYSKLAIFTDAYRGNDTDQNKLIMRVFILIIALSGEDLPSDEEIASAVDLMLNNPNPDVIR